MDIKVVNRVLYKNDLIHKITHKHTASPKSGLKYLLSNLQIPYRKRWRKVTKLFTDNKSLRFFLFFHCILVQKSVIDRHLSWHLLFNFHNLVFQSKCFWGRMHSILKNITLLFYSSVKSDEIFVLWRNFYRLIFFGEKICCGHCFFR